MVVVPEPEIDSVPLLALVMEPLSTSSFVGVAEVDDRVCRRRNRQ